MNRRFMQIGVVLALVAIIFFGTWKAWVAIYMRAASAALQARTKALVDNNPQLKPAWDKALTDKVLTRAEAKEIVEAGGEKVADDE